MVRKAGENELKILANLAVKLWENNSVDELSDEFFQAISKGHTQFFLKSENDVPVGFAQCKLRYDYVEGTKTTPVGYLEGIFIKEEYRGKGYAKELVRACEVWAKKRGCREFASDCELENTSGLHFHQAMNFTEANRIICFIKEL